MMKQKYYLRANYLRLLLSTAIIGFISFVLFFICAMYSENGNGQEPMFYIVRALFILFSFPAVLFANGLGWMGLVIGVLAGAVFYGLLLEFIFAALLRKAVR